MSRDKLIILGVAVLGLLGFLVFQQAKKDESLGRPLASAKDFPSISASDDIDKISLKNGDKGEVVLQRVPDPTGTPTDGGTATLWELTKPVAAAANQQSVKDLVANLKELKIDAPVNLKLDDAIRKDKQLDPEHAMHVVAWKGSDKKIAESFGKSGPAGQLVVLAGTPDAVWAAKGYSAYLYTKEAKDFREKELLKFDDGNVSRVSIANTHGAFSFTKGDKWAATFDKKPIARFDEEKVRDFLRAYKGLNAGGLWRWQVDLGDGLDKPDAHVVIELKDGAGRFELLVGKVASGSNRWAKRGDSDAIYQISSYAADFALADTGKYQSAVDAGTPDGGGKGKK